MCFGSQRFEVSADFVCHIALRSDAIRAHDDEIDEATLKQMPGVVIHDQGVWHAVLAQLKGRERSSLAAWSCFADPYMHIHACIMRLIYRSECHAPVHRRQPTCVAMRHDVQRSRGICFLSSDSAEQLQRVLADGTIRLDILIANHDSFMPSGLGA